MGKPSEAVMKTVLSWSKKGNWASFFKRPEESFIPNIWEGVESPFLDPEWNTIRPTFSKEVVKAVEDTRRLNEEMAAAEEKAAAEEEDRKKLEAKVKEDE